MMPPFHSWPRIQGHLRATTVDKPASPGAIPRQGKQDFASPPGRLLSLLRAHGDDDANAAVRSQLARTPVLVTLPCHRNATGTLPDRQARPLSVKRPAA